MGPPALDVPVSGDDRDTIRSSGDRRRVEGRARPTGKTFKRRLRHVIYELLYFGGA